jgi:hypothetical protein
MKLLQKKAVVPFLTHRDDKQWSNCSFPPLLHKKTVVLLPSKRGGGQRSKYIIFGNCSVQSEENACNLERCQATEQVS